MKTELKIWKELLINKKNFHGYRRVQSRTGGKAFN